MASPKKKTYVPEIDIKDCNNDYTPVDSGDCKVSGLTKGGSMTCTVRDTNTDTTLSSTVVVDGGSYDADGKKDGCISYDYDVPSGYDPKCVVIDYQCYGADKKAGTWDDVTFTRPAVAVECDDEAPYAGIELSKDVACILDKNGKKDYDQIVDSAGDKIVYKFTITNTGNVDLKDIKLFDKVECNGIEKILDGYTLEAGCSITFYYTYCVTKDDLAKARDVETITTYKGFFKCTEKVCTGDLEIDNYAYVSATACLPTYDDTPTLSSTDDGYGYEKVYVSDYDEASAYVTCPKGCKSEYCYDEPYNPADYGVSSMAQLQQQFQQAAAA